jgi:hypothetical protein
MLPALLYQYSVKIPKHVYSTIFIEYMCAHFFIEDDAEILSAHFTCKVAL